VQLFSTFALIAGIALACAVGARLTGGRQPTNR